MNFFDHKDLGNHLLQLCPKVVKHPVFDREISLKITNFYNFPPPLASFLQRQNQRGRERWGTEHIWGKRDSLENLGTKGRKISKWFSEKDTGKTETERTWLRIGANGVLW